MKDDSFDCTLIAHLRIFLLFYRLLYCLILPENRLFFGIWKVVEIDVELYINDDKELFRNLLLHKDEIESVMGLVLDWRELPERKASRIIIEKEVTFDNRATWSQQFDYIMDVCMKMKKAFKKYL